MALVMVVCRAALAFSWRVPDLPRDPGPDGKGAEAGKSYECVLGDVWLTAGDVGGAIPAHGQLLPTDSNAAPFSLLDPRYGGNGTTTFQLPDPRHVEPRGLDGPPLTYVICVRGFFPTRG